MRSIKMDLLITFQVLDRKAALGRINLLAGKDLGRLVQARTKGPGHGSISRAFYALSAFVAHILNLQKVAFMGHVLPGTSESEWT